MPDSALPSERELYACGICGKKFDRRDLRNRHKRRCIRSISNPRKSKQKSCYSCATSKISCDLRLPSCSRCTIRKISCEYASGTGNREEKKLAGDAENLSDTNGQAIVALENSVANEKDVQNHAGSSLQMHLPIDDIRAESTSLPSDRPSEDPRRSSLRPHGSELVDSPQYNGGMNSSTAQSSETSSSHITNEELARTRANIENLQHFLDSDLLLDKALVETGTLTLSPGYQFSSAQSPFQVNETSALSDGYNIQWLNSSLANFQPTSEHDGGNCLSNFSIEPLSDFSFNLMGSFGIPGSHTPTNAFQKVSTGCPGSVFNTPFLKPPLRPETHNYADEVSEDRLSLVLLNGPSRITPVDPINISKDVQDQDQQVSAFDQGNDLPSYPFNSVSRQISSNKFPTKILLEFPQMMARPGGKYPPFVHHRIYRCEEGDVLKPLAIAFCCVTALNTAFPSGKGFVHSLINAERDRLLRELRLLRDSELDMIATMHAMCVYQIIGFFDDSSPDSARSAELQQPFFLRMARRLVAMYMPQLRSSYDSGDFSELAWGNWSSTETVRRTFFLIHIINVIACRTEKQNPYFYEELDDELVMNLPLPAPEKLWKANSAAEWKSALEEELRGGWQPNITANTILSGNRWKDDDLNATECDISSDSMLPGGKAAGRSLHEVYSASSHEFSRLVIHCIDRKIRE